MSAMSVNYLIGIIVGLVVAVFIIKACNKNNKFKSDYDERQQIKRGKSYCYGMYTAWILLGILMMLDLVEVKIPAEPSVIYFTVVMVSLLVQTVYAILNDAYFGMNNRIKTYCMVFLILTVINGGVGILYAVNGKLIENGLLCFRVLNLEIAVAFVIMAIVLFVKSKMKSEEVEEE